MKTESYRADIDGLRALAVLSVLLFHARLGCPGGFVGVDVFFVISGYLITSLILKEQQSGNFSLFQFWERRIRRILPALVAVTAATFVAGCFFLLPQDLAALGKSVIAQAFLVSNIYFWSQSGYFEAASSTQPLLHTWSLAVEEQFYLFFPLLLLFFAGRRNVHLVKAIILLAVVSFGLSIYCTQAWGSFNFYWLPTRAWELMTGALLAAGRGRFSPSQKIAEVLGWFGLGLLGMAVFLYDDNTQFPGLAAATPCVATALIIFSSELRTSQVGRVLSLKPVVFVGLISYSLYLWHWPVLVFYRYYSFDEPSATARVILLVVSGVLAIVSWKFVENPVRVRRLFQSRRQIFSFAATAGLALFTIGFLACESHGFPSRLPDYAIHPVDTNSYTYVDRNVTLDDAKAGKFFALGSPAATSNTAVNLLVWGDSHAMALTPVIDELCRQHSWRGVQATHSSTAPVLKYSCTAKYSLHENTVQFNDAIFDYIARTHVSNVLMAAFWSSYIREDPAHAEFFKTQLVETVRAVMKTGARVYLVKDVPEPGFDVPRYITMAELRGRALDTLGVTFRKYQLENQGMEATFEKISQTGATVFAPADYFLIRKDFYGVIKNGDVLYWDPHHLTVEGARMLAPLFEPIFGQN